MNKPTYPDLNPVQGSRSISSTYPRKGSLASLLIFQYESTVIAYACTHLCQSVPVYAYLHPTMPVRLLSNVPLDHFVSSKHNFQPRSLPRSLPLLSHSLRAFTSLSLASFLVRTLIPVLLAATPILLASLGQ